MKNFLALGGSEWTVTSDNSSSYEQDFRPTGKAHGIKMSSPWGKNKQQNGHSKTEGRDTRKKYINIKKLFFFTRILAFQVRAAILPLAFILNQQIIFAKEGAAHWWPVQKKKTCSHFI